MSVGGRVFARVYDQMMKGTEKAGLRAHREVLLRRAGGRVVEIGAGTGANLPFYGDAVSELTLTDPEAPMLRRLHRLAEGRAELFRAPAEDLPFEDDSFDVAVSTLVLCTVDDQPRAIRELRRVLRPGGQLLFIEHVRSDAPRLATWQDRLNPLNRIVAHGCNCNRPTLGSIRSGGFEVGQLEHDRLRKAPPFVSPLIVGRATAQ